MFLRVKYWRWSDEYISWCILCSMCSNCFNKLRKWQTTVFGFCSDRDAFETVFKFHMIGIVDLIGIIFFNFWSLAHKGNIEVTWESLFKLLQQASQGTYYRLWFCSDRDALKLFQFCMIGIVDLIGINFPTFEVLGIKEI